VKEKICLYNLTITNFLNLPQLYYHLGLGLLDDADQEAALFVANIHQKFFSTKRIERAEDGLGIAWW